MKVIAATADSSSLKNFEFGRDIDTSVKDSKQPAVDILVPAPPGPKKAQAITHISQLNSRSVFSRKTGEVFIDQDKVAQLNGEVVGLFTYYSNISQSGFVIAFSSTGEVVIVSENDYNKKVQLKVREDLAAVAMNPESPLQFASGGAEVLPDVFHIQLNESEGQLEATINTEWTALQAPNNYLDLPERNLVTGLTFLPKSAHIVATTSHGKLRLYDISGRNSQPEEMVQASKDSIKSIVSDPSHPGTVIIGDARTTVSRWSTSPFKLLGFYKGVSGSTRALSIRGPFLATGGLDRYIRIFDVVKRQPAGKVYTGEEIWDINLVRHDIEEDTDDMDNLWDRLGSKRRKVQEKEAPEESSEEEVSAEDDSEELDSDFSEDEEAIHEAQDAHEEEDSGEESEEDSEGGDESFQGFDD